MQMERNIEFIMKAKLMGATGLQLELPKESAKMAIVCTCNAADCLCLPVLPEIFYFRSDRRRGQRVVFYSEVIRCTPFRETFKGFPGFFIAQRGNRRFATYKRDKK
ncbi:MAG: hypothetical protein ACLSAP_06775 [Oscillospiraceae bacterium]